MIFGETFSRVESEGIRGEKNLAGAAGEGGREIEKGMEGKVFTTKLEMYKRQSIDNTNKTNT